MKTSKKPSSSTQPTLKTGLFNKAEAAHYFISGFCHIHSSILGSQDPGVAITHRLLNGETTFYPWEIATETKIATLTNSNERMAVLETIANNSLFAQKSQNNHTLKQIFDELMTNAFYHSYKDKAGKDKYQRNKPALLSPEETVTVYFKENSQGANLVVEDQGGCLTLSDFARTFERCYPSHPSAFSMDTKSSGAGLGLFLIFELASHIHVSISRQKTTRFSVWIADSNKLDPDTFSINIFER